MNTYTLFTQKVFGGYFPFSNMGMVSHTYLVCMRNLSLYHYMRKNLQEHFVLRVHNDAENDVDVINSVQAYLH